MDMSVSVPAARETENADENQPTTDGSVAFGQQT